MAVAPLSAESHPRTRLADFVVQVFADRVTRDSEEYCRQGILKRLRAERSSGSGKNKPASDLLSHGWFNGTATGTDYSHLASFCSLTLWHGTKSSSTGAVRNVERRCGRALRASKSPKPLREGISPTLSRSNRFFPTIGLILTRLSRSGSKCCVIPVAEADCAAMNKSVIFVAQPNFPRECLRPQSMSKGVVVHPRLRIRSSDACQPSTPIASTVAIATGLFAQTPPSISGVP